MRTFFALAPVLCGLSSGPARALTTIPFVGCVSDAMNGQHFAAPSGKPLRLNLPPKIAAKLALYAGASRTILAPRGWRCSGALWGDGERLDITPPTGSPHANETSISIGTWGEGSGFYTAMQIAGRYFPDLVSDEEIKSFIVNWGYGGTVAQFLGPRYPSDELTYLNASSLEYETPPGKDGIEQLVLGSTSPFAQFGIISLHLIKYESGYDEHDSHINFINVNLPPDLAYLTPYVLAASRPCILHEDHASCTMHDDITYANQ